MSSGCRPWHVMISVFSHGVCRLARRVGRLVSTEVLYMFYVHPHNRSRRTCTPHVHLFALLLNRGFVGVFFSANQIMTLMKARTTAVGSVIGVAGGGMLSISPLPTSASDRLVIACPFGRT